MNNLLKEGTFILHFGEGVKIKYKPQKSVLGPDRVEIKTKYQLLGKEEEVLAPWVDNITYDEKTKILIFEDSIVLNGGNSVTFRFMTDLTGKQVGGIGNDYEPKLETKIILDGNTEDNFAKYESYRKEFKERIQRKVDRIEEMFEESQTEVIAHLMKKGKKM